MQQELEELVATAEQAVTKAQTLPELDQVRVSYLGKKGSVTALMQSLGAMTPDERREAGKVINVAKQAVQGLIEARRELLQQAELDAKLASESIDVTLPGRGQQQGGCGFSNDASHIPVYRFSPGPV